MTISTTENRITYEGDGTSVAFPYPRYFGQQADLVVLLVASSGATTTQVLNVHYTISGTLTNNVFANGGTVTMNAAPASGETLVIYADPPITQGTDYAATDPFPAETHEAALDKLTVIAQRTREMVDRSVRVSEGETATAELPMLAERANMYAYFNSAGNLVGLGDVADPISGGGLRIFGSVAEATAAIVPSSSGAVIVSGYAQPGDGGHAMYVRDTAGQFTSADGQAWSLVDGQDICPEMFGAVNDNTADDSAAMQDFFDYISGNLKVRRGVMRGRYLLQSTVTIPDPNNMTIYAGGARLNTTQDILMIDANGLADPTYQSTESVQNFHWYGGEFNCAAASPTKATGIRLLGFRHATFEPEEMDGWFNCVETGGKDTIRIGKFKSFRCHNAVVFVPPWSARGGPLMLNLNDIHGSLGTNDAAMLRSYMPLTDCKIAPTSCNLGDGYTNTNAVIDIQRSLLMACTSVTGTLSPGETLTGGTSGATCTYDETYVHPFDFTLAAADDYKTWIVCSARSGLFAQGETVTGGTSGATFMIGDHDGYLVQNTTWRNTVIDVQHWESGSEGSGDCTLVRLRNLEAAGQGALGMQIDMGSAGVSGTTGVCVGVDLQGVRETTISGVFAQSGSSIPIKLNPNCANIRIAEAHTRFSTGVIDLNGMSRDELNLSDFDKRLRRPRVVTDWDPQTLSSGSGVIDMSAAFANFGLVGGLAPIEYDVVVVAKDSASETSGSGQTPRFRLHQPASPTPAASTMSLVALRGVPDGVERGADISVGADESGDIAWNALATGTDTMTVSLLVRSVRY